MAATDDSMIPASGAVFTFGKSKFADNLPNRFWVKNDKVLQTACGDEHTALVAESGRVFTFGANDWGQLGIGSTKSATKPTCVKEFKHEKASLVACGRVHTLVATESGKLYSFGANGEGQLGVEDVPSSDKPLEISSIKPQKYKMLAAGADHSIALTEDGDLYVWGGGSEGQLGLGDQTECPNPTELKTEDAVVCVACGYYHTAFVTDTGDLYTFGETDGGKLGLGDDYDKTDTPQKVSLPEKATWVSCGGSHTVVLSESGKVYTFGDGSNGQLGHNTKILHSESPHQLSFKHKVTHISCGENHTAIITERGQLFTFGDGRHGKLGLGQDSFSNQLIPSKVERFNKFFVESVSCGGCHMIVRAHMKLQNGEVESSEDEEEELEEAKTSLNNSLKLDGSIDPGGTFSARDRRRQTVTRSPSLNRTLPPLANGKPASPLSHTVPAIKTQSPLAREIIPRKTETESDVNKNEDDTENNKNQNQANHVQQIDQIEAVNDTQVRSSPRPMPRPLPRKKQEDEKKDDEEKKQEESEEDESEEEETIKEKDKSEEDEKKKKEESEEEEEEEEIKSEDETQKTTNQVRSLPSVPVPSPRAKDIKSDEEDEEEEEEEEEEENKKEEDIKEKKKKDEKKKDKKKDKKKKTNIFGRKSTGLSDDEDEEEEEEDEIDEEEEIKEEEVKEKDKKKDKEDKKKKDKDKKKDKKDKKDKKKDKKKKKDDEEEEDEEEEDEEEGKSKKDKKKDKKDKKDKKKDKDKKGKKNKDKDEDNDDEEEDDDEKDSKKKDKNKEKDKDDDKKNKEEDENKPKEEEDKKSDGDKKEEKKEEQKPPPKKSRTCTIL